MRKHLKRMSLAVGCLCILCGLSGCKTNTNDSNKITNAPKKIENQNDHTISMEQNDMTNNDNNSGNKTITKTAEPSETSDIEVPMNSVEAGTTKASVKESPAPSIPDEPDPSNPEKSNPDNTVIPDSEDDPDQADTPNIVVQETEGPTLVIGYEIDSKDIASTFALSIDEVIEKYGDPYEIVSTGIGSTETGYKFTNGLVYIVKEDGKTIDRIDCEDCVTFHGVHNGMIFDEINTALGQEELKMGDIKEDGEYYYTTYTEDDLILYFKSKDGWGIGSHMSIYHV